MVQDYSEFKKLLHSRKKTIEEELGSIAKKDPHVEGNWESKFPQFEGAGDTFDLEEASNEVEEYVTRLPLEYALELRLKAINDALERIEKGTYGICKNCNEKIPKKRLEALPETRLCLKCSNKKKK